MQKYRIFSLVVLLGALSCQSSFAADAGTSLSNAVTQGVQYVTETPHNRRALASLVVALKDEIKAQGLDKVSAIAAAVVANAGIRTAPRR